MCGLYLTPAQTHYNLVVCTSAQEHLKLYIKLFLSLLGRITVKHALHSFVIKHEASRGVDRESSGGLRSWISFWDLYVHLCNSCISVFKFEVKYEYEKDFMSINSY